MREIWKRVYLGFSKKKRHFITAAWVKNSNGLTHIGHTYVSQCPIIFPVVHLGFQIVRLRAASASLEEIESHYSIILPPCH